ncbi:MAG TPA: TAXI family TRAP transporter solute-binding subunit [Micromonosporaceae bacterium]|nr:TAXI family TRAP transporter solute-binding subunit [Micromonosporaceae bacterium]
MTGARRRATRLLLVALLTGGLTACTSAPAEPGLWHDGRLYIGTGNTTGTYYQLGGGFADLISNHLPGFEARAEPTGASGDNVERVASRDMDIAFCNADTAADAATGKGSFAGRQQPVRALARLYQNTMQVVVRTEARIATVADMRGKRVSTSSPNSGTDVMAGRIIEAAGLDPDKDLTRLRISLAETTRAMRAGTMDAMFFTGGLPTPGISDLIASAPAQFLVLPIGALLAPLTARYGQVYTTATIASSVYRTAGDVVTIVVPSLLIVHEEMPEGLAHQLTRLLFEHQRELATVHPEGGNFDRRHGPETAPVPLHPGAQQYYGSG